MSGKFPCSCCGYLVWDYSDGTFEICDICLWQDDPVQNTEPDFSGGANSVSLNEAKDNFKKFGASEEKFRNMGRKPYSWEIPNEHKPRGVT